MILLMLNHDEDITWIKEEWKNFQTQLEQALRERNKNKVRYLMEKCLDLYRLFLLVTNDLDTALSLESIDLTDLHFRPINLEERLGFIQNRPELFHSYRQLTEIMIEQEKLYAKKLIMKKASRPNA